MNLRQHVRDVFGILAADETLLRLLYYKPANEQDDPLASDKPDILAKPEGERQAIIVDVIRTIRDLDDLDEEEKCRIVCYPRLRRETANPLIANQDMAIDIYCHHAFESVDARTAWIADRVNALLFGKRLSSVGKTLLYAGNSIQAPPRYAGYRLIYSFGSENY